MAYCLAPVSISGGSHLKARELSSAKSATFGKTPKLIVQRKSNQLETNHKFSIRAEYGEGSQRGGGDFIAGFLVGGAVFGTLAYVFAPQGNFFMSNSVTWMGIHSMSKLLHNFHPI